MPYIDQESRKRLDPAITEVARAIFKPGDLNYVIFRLLRILTTSSYHEQSRWRAAVTDSADEFYRRDMGPIEDDAIQRNGDVFP